MPFIHRRNEILCSRRIEPAHCLHNNAVSFFFRLNQKNNSPCFNCDSELLCPIINIYQKKIVKKKILQKIILIHPFMVSHDQISNLTYTQPADHLYVIPNSMDHQNIFQFIHMVQDWKKCCLLLNRL